MAVLYRNEADKAAVDVGVNWVYGLCGGLPSTIVSFRIPKVFRIFVLLHVLEILSAAISVPSNRVRAFAPQRGDEKILVLPSSHVL